MLSPFEFFGIYARIEHFTRWNFFLFFFLEIQSDSCKVRITRTLKVPYTLGLNILRDFSFFFGNLTRFLLKFEQNRRVLVRITRTLNVVKEWGRSSFHELERNFFFLFFCQKWPPPRDVGAINGRIISREALPLERFVAYRGPRPYIRKDIPRYRLLYAHKSAYVCSTGRASSDSPVEIRAALAQDKRKIVDRPSRA